MHVTNYKGSLVLGNDLAILGSILPSDVSIVSSASAHTAFSAFLASVVLVPYVGPFPRGALASIRPSN